LTILYFPYILLAQEYGKRIDSLVAQYADNAEFAGSILVVKNGKLLLKKGYGYSHTEQLTPHDASTIFNIASLTKPFTAALILKLAEDGKLSIDDQLSKYYPTYPGGERISLHHLLTHTSGIANYTDDKNFWSMDQSKEVSLEKMISFFKDKPLDFEPGSRFRYSNSGYTMLGYIIERVTRMPYGKALELFIFKPLGMRHSSYGPPVENKGLAKGYMMYYKNFSNPAFTVHPSISYATGAIYSTVEDLYKWHLALQRRKFLSKESLDAAYCRDKGAYGFGWFTDSLYGKQRVSHDGNIPGYKANINRIPEDDVCVIALSNANNSGVGGMVRNIMNILYHQPLSKTFAEQPVIAMPDSIKQSFAGLYKFREEDSLKISVRLKDTALIVAIDGQSEFEILPVFKNQFKSGQTRVEFMMNKEGKPEQILIYRKGEIIGAKKVQ
jgi:CubicO group peptidase (beta-lactamase class C family)